MKRALGSVRRAARSWIGGLAAGRATACALALALGLAVIPILDLVTASPPALAAEQAAKNEPPRTWHATAFVSGIGNYRIIHYWSEGTSMRAETLIGGHPITTIVRGNRYAVIDRLTGRALEVERSAKAVAADQGRPRPFAFEQSEIRAAGGEKVEETKLSGVEVEVWRVTDDQGRRTAWVSRAEPRVPLRVETFVRGSTQTVKVDYSNWGFDLELPPAFFELPPGLEVERLSYEEFGKKSASGPVGPAPILYPDLLHGMQP